jgi:hypothetical protein
MNEDELRAGGVAHRAVFAAFDVLGGVARGALRGRHVMASRARNGLVTGEIRLATINHGSLRRLESRLRGCVVDAGLLEGSDAHVMPNGGMACVALAALGVIGMGEAWGAELHVGVAALTALTRYGRDLVERELGVTGYVRRDFLEGNDLMLHASDGAHINVALDAGDVLMRTLRPCRVERSHLVAG